MGAEQSTPVTAETTSKLYETRLCEAVQLRFPPELAELIGAFAALPTASDDTLSNTYHMRDFFCPAVSKSAGTDVNAQWVAATHEVVVLGNVAFVTGTCATCNSSHLLRRDLSLEHGWSVMPQAVGCSAASLAVGPEMVVWASERGEVFRFDAQGREIGEHFFTIKKNSSEFLIGLACAGDGLLAVTSAPYGNETWGLDLTRWSLPCEPSTTRVKCLKRKPILSPEAGNNWGRVALCYDSRQKCSFFAAEGADRFFRLDDTATCNQPEGFGWRTFFSVIAMELDSDAETLYVLDRNRVNIFCFSARTNQLVSQFCPPTSAQCTALALDRPTNSLYVLEQYATSCSLVSIQHLLSSSNHSNHAFIL